MIKYLFIFLCLVGCTAQDLSNFAPTTKERVNRIQYMKDTRTNLCFTVSDVNEYPLGTAIIFSNVPCSEEVEKLIKANQ